ncbi:hypothetical protein KFL_009090030 [Klebsormidium nitens]|uniref:Uncharacterized protein n=1 Tax=Klebsormidium nitens TaxID=105231 RepID=A0A1Y1IN14_KLENI|nr:hypothetical protein KFL_009090030 [Klebsormidium nitens]|eukprot:GAQ92043.1 hypothetical protein KFL_009090030 [Klebsormidium nitens]
MRQYCQWRRRALLPASRLGWTACRLAEGRNADERNGRNAVSSLSSDLVGALLALQGPQMALAGVQKVGEFTGSGFIFKDSIEVMSIDDPKVSGVTIFVSDFQRSLTDRLSKDFFNEPSQASITCAQTSPLRIVGKIAGKEGEEIFQETKNFLAFKTLHVRRIFDEKKNALVYVAYSTRFQSDNDKVSAGRYRTSICTVPLFNAVVQNDAGAPGDGSG